MVEKFIEIFQGLRLGYGLTKRGNVSEQGKVESSHRWVEKELTKEIVQGHLDGTGDNLGIVPINENNKCKWGAIDIDEYTFNHKEFTQKMRELKIPLIVCRSTSGGAHLYLFTKDFVEAKDMRQTLLSLTASLGLVTRKDKIFPQQTKINVETNDRGNFCSLPYYKHKTGTKYAINDDGSAASLESFYSMYDRYSVDPSKLSEIKVELNEKAKAVSNGPPCLEVLCSQGFPKGTRNNGLYNIGVYLKKSLPDEWETLIEDYNRKYLNPPLSNAEVENVKKSLRKKDYNYSCNEQPINSFCNRELCRTRKHGIGLANTALPEISNLTKINHKPQPQWFVNVDGERLELETDDLQIQARFKKACMEQLNTIIPRVADRQWDTLLRVLFSAIQIIEPPESLLIKNQLEDLIEDFAVRRAQGRQKSDILRGVPYTADGETMFRWKDLKKFLERQKWSFDIRKTGAMIEDIFNTTEKTLNIDGKRVRVWVMKAMEKQNTSFEKPKYKEEDAF